MGIPACNTQVFGRQPRQHDRTPRDTAHSGRTAGGVQGACRTLSLSRTDLVKRARSTTIRVEYEAAGCAERFFPLHLLLFCPLLTPHALIVLDLFGLAVCEYPSRDPRRRPRCWHAGSSIAQQTRKGNWFEIEFVHAECPTGSLSARAKRVQGLHLDTEHRKGSIRGRTPLNVSDLPLTCAQRTAA